MIFKYISSLLNYQFWRSISISHILPWFKTSFIGRNPSFNQYNITIMCKVAQLGFTEVLTIANTKCYWHELQIVCLSNLFIIYKHESFWNPNDGNWIISKDHQTKNACIVEFSQLETEIIQLWNYLCTH
jgi:hypothetical protein